MIARLLRAVLVCVSLAVPAAAQDAPDLAEWDRIEAQAEALIAQDDPSMDALDRMREELVQRRSAFTGAQDANAGRIDSLRAEIAALGVAPEDGTAEPPELTARRADLEQRLEVLVAPVREAQAAFTSADGLIREIDAIGTARRAEALLSQDAPPLNPVTWLPAFEAVSAWIVGLGTELARPFATAEARDAWMRNGVQLGGLTFAAILLLWRSGVWLGHLRDRVAPKEAESPGARLALVVIGLGKLLLPVLGLLAVTRILAVMGAVGLRADAASWMLPAMGAVVLAARMLAHAAFPPRAEAPTLLPLEMPRRREGRLHATVLGVYFALAILLTGMAETSRAVAETRAVPVFILLVLAGLSLLRLGRLLLKAGHAARTDEGSISGQLLGLVGRGLMAVGVVAPILAGVGYVNLGEALLWPATLSLALLAAISLLQGVVFDLYALVAKRRDTARDALAPTLIAIALATASLPLFALVWGVRRERLLEWWEAFLRGFRVGEARIAPENFLTFVLVFAIGYALVRLLKNVLRTSVLPKTKLDSGGTNAIISGTGYVGITIAALLAITTAGIDLSGLAIVAGALSVGVGFGLQTVVQNFVSGIILLIERPIKIGDWINVNGTEGFVREISVRSTRIETFDRQDVVVPNADLIAGSVTNYTLGNSAGRVVLTVGVAYGTDTRRVQALLEQIAESHPLVILNPPPLVTFDGFGADSLNFTVRVVLRDILFKVTVASELNHLIAERFAEEGIEIPFAQRDVWLRNPEALQPARPETP